MRTLAIVMILCILLSVGCSQEKSNYDAGISAYKREYIGIALYDFELRAMEKNDPIAQFCLGYIYDQDLKVYKSKAKEWYEKAAHQGYAPAQNNLGLMYTFEAVEAYLAGARDDMRANLRIASQWLQKAEKQQNNSIPQLNNGLLEYLKARLSGNKREAHLGYKTSVSWYEKAAHQGYAPAQNELALMYHRGYGIDERISKTQRGKKAIELLEKAARQNYAPAQNNLALMYQEDENVERWKEVIELLEKAAHQNHAPAQHQLALMYHRGYGIDERISKTQRGKKAIEWYEKAARQNYAPAQNNLARIYAGGKVDGETVVDKNPEKALRLYFEAAQQGQPISQAQLGQYFENGTDKIPQDNAEAYYWYGLALKRPDKLNEAINIKSYASKVAKWHQNVGNHLDEEKDEIQERVDNWKPRYLHGFGTGFYVDKEHIITNAHVATWKDHDGNKHKYDELRADFRYVVEKPGVESVDHDADLALLLDQIGNMDTATFRSQGTYVGEDLAVFGYPMGNILAYKGNLTSGTVSALSGLINRVFHDHPSNLFQHTAPQQGGNSGGPVFDGAGNVVGISVSSLYGFRVENVHFAIKFEVIEKFLKKNEITVNSALNDTENIDKVITLQEIFTKAEKFTVPVWGYKNKSPLSSGELMIRIGIDDIGQRNFE